MVKARVTCRDCPCLEGFPGFAFGLCWRPYDGPQVVDATQAGFCGNEWLEVPHGMTPREVWLAGHEHDRKRLDEMLVLLRLASAGARIHVEGGEVNR